MSLVPLNTGKAKVKKIRYNNITKVRTLFSAYLPFQRHINIRMQEPRDLSSMPRSRKLGQPPQIYSYVNFVLPKTLGLSSKIAVLGHLTLDATITISATISNPAVEILTYLFKQIDK